MQTKLTSCFQSLDNKSGRMSKRWKIGILIFFCTLAQNATAEISEEKLEQFIEAISIRLTYSEEMSQMVATRLESFDADIEPYIRETIASESHFLRTRTIHAITVTESTEHLHYIVDRFLNDEDETVRNFACSSIHVFLQKHAPEELFDAETIEKLGGRAMKTLADETREIRHSERMTCLRLIRNLKYTEARDFLVDIWNEWREGFRPSAVLETLYALDRDKADELLYRQDACEILGHDRTWFRALARSAEHNEKSLAIVNEIIESVVERRSEYTLPTQDAIAVALMLGRDEHIQLVLDVISEGDKTQKFRAVVTLVSHPKSILRGEEDLKNLGNAIKENEYLYNNITHIYRNGTVEGTIAQWLMSPDSPLWDNDENGLEQTMSLRLIIRPEAETE